MEKFKLSRNIAFLLGILFALLVIFILGSFQKPEDYNSKKNIIILANNIYKKWEKTKDRKIIIIDFSKSMNTERLYIVDLDLQEIIMESKVCHGIGSGKSNIPNKFSNIANTKTSSKGIMRTAETYSGKYGYAMRVDGLQNINSNVRNRAIVFHDASVQKTPWSWGCFSTPSNKYKKIIDITKNGTLLFVFSNINDINKY
jgi:hypothetical protein